MRRMMTARGATNTKVRSGQGPRGGEVVVLGASTGVGWATAVRLHQQYGFSVTGTVRRESDAARLREQGVKSLVVDVTVADDLAELRAWAKARPLVGAVINAGISSPGPLEFAAAEDLRRLFEVNVIGQVGVVQALLPGLRAGAGRIISVGSPSGRFISPLNGAYGASKAASTALHHAWRRELADQGITAVLVEPGGMKTPFMSRHTATLRDALERGSPQFRARYGAQIDATIAVMDKTYGPFATRPETVAEVIGKALTRRTPHNRYLVGVDARAMSAMARCLPSRLLDEMFRKSVPRKHDVSVEVSSGETVPITPERGSAQ